ncbi:uncharacterized protein F58A4.6-like [Amphiura filiformis]|uniref:uncharacterized protein F58A4.6-like n=1 Tax=Amphiura filiformis TaxID=82378 RepID=UPI003B20C4FC
MDPLLASCLTSELHRSVCFRKAFMVLLERHCRNHHCRKQCQDIVTKQMNFKVFLQLTDVKFFRLDPDIRWSDRMLPWWTIRLLLEEAFSWLSTLGGAYSSLGENFSHCAIEAGRLSIRQLKLAIRLGDPLLQARCYVYLSLSLMQRGFLKQARNIISHQYKFAVSLGEHSDTRLIAMCHGVWCHLRFHYQRRRQMRETRQCGGKMGRDGHSMHQNGTKSVNPSILGQVVF